MVCSSVSFRICPISRHVTILVSQLCHVYFHRNVLTMPVSENFKQAKPSQACCRSLLQVLEYLQLPRLQRVLIPTLPPHLLEARVPSQRQPQVASHVGALRISHAHSLRVSIHRLPRFTHTKSFPDHLYSIQVGMIQRSLSQYVSQGHGTIHTNGTTSNGYYLP